MSRITGKHQHWDEFHWEEEIRRDERRISGYFRELASCLDLPCEEELIYDQLASQTDLVPSSDAAESLYNWLNGNEEDADDECAGESRNRRRTVEAATVDELDMLCSEWNILISVPMPEAVLFAALGTSCAFAKLLARAADFFEPAPGEYTPALLLSLGKRTLRDLNDTAARISGFASCNSCFRDKCSELVNRLAEIRERIICRLEQLR